MNDRISEIIAAYLSGEVLSESERQEVEAWLREHDGEKEVEVLRGMFRSARLVKEAPGTRGASVMKKIEAKVVSRRAGRKLKIRWSYSVAAAIAVLLCSVLLYRWLGTNQENQVVPRDVRQNVNTSIAHLKLNTGEVVELEKYDGKFIREDSVQIANENATLRYTSTDSVAPEKVEFNTLVIPRGSEYNIVLADGTKVFLNAGSEISYPVVFAGDKREVKLKGEAYFEVRKDERRPFFVQAGDVQIQVLGTSFNVTAYPGRGRIETTLEEGKIQLTDGRESVEVSPGKQAIYDIEDGRFEVKQVDTKLYTAWKDGYYKFDQMTLEDIMETLALWYDLNVFYRNPGVKSLEFTGRLRRYDEVVSLFEKLEQTGLVVFEVNGKNVIIKEK
ncbi:MULTISPECIES: FecR domain-containing protein [Butyricimonas]|uniref:FecR domain-containing protein n=1 Tax=Butyricimonas TaxID=574697 RepID=UPI001D08AADB|nr:MULTISPECIES: FecR domain-containing protein [Butyricimonas]MCB6972353.1 FecR domain-containing protein [Butyricimonas synergistica]MCG4519361.1 FecR domain-containing protein [Butyricimonas sp. DFI.6.44]